MVISCIDSMKEWIVQGTKNSATENIKWIKNNPEKAASILWYFTTDMERITGSD